MQVAGHEIEEIRKATGDAMTAARDIAEIRMVKFELKSYYMTSGCASPDSSNSRVKRSAKTRCGNCYGSNFVRLGLEHYLLR